MNPIVLVGLGLLAAVALGKRRTSAGGDQSGNGGTTGNGGGGNGGTTGNGSGGNGGTGVQLVVPLSQPGAPMPGTFYPVSSADLEVNRELIDAVASMALFDTPTMVAQQVAAYAKCINRSDWNRYYYGVADTGNTVVDGMSASLAFDKQNPDALKALEGGRWPTKYMAFGPTIPPSQRNKFGLLWLPSIQESVTARGMGVPPDQIVCSPSGLNPPSSLLSKLSGTAPPWAQQGGYA